MKKNIRKSVYVAVLFCISLAIISCENDFTDIGSNVISNTKFDTNSIALDITADNRPVEKVQSDNISRQLNQYLLGVYASSDYEKLEASVVTQVGISLGLQVIDEENVYGADTTVVTKIDTVFIKLPYQVTLNSTTSEFELDSIIGDQTKAFNLNVYRSNTFINLFDPADPTKINKFFSNDVFQKSGTELNEEVNFPFIPNVNDTAVVIKRRLFDDSIATMDTVQYFNSVSVTNPVPFARIPLNEEKFQELFLDKYESTEFASQDAFNDYFRGLIIEASGTEGSLISFNFNNSNANFNPSIEVYYTNTVLKGGNTILDTITKNNSFPLSGFRVNTFNMDDKVYPVNEEIIIQGTAGSEATINLFGDDLDSNGIADKIEELREKNWLINDATLTFYINQSADIASVPDRLYLYKNNANLTIPSFSQLTDALTESAAGGILGGLELDDEGNAEKYTFKLTDYISDILNGDTDYSPSLILKAYNPSDEPISAADTIFRNYNWNPKAVTLFNSSVVDENKKAVLNISYSEKK